MKKVHITVQINGKRRHITVNGRYAIHRDTIASEASHMVRKAVEEYPAGFGKRGEK